MWGVWCVRSAASAFGAAAAWAKVGGKIFRGTEDEAKALATKWRTGSSSNVSYYARPMGTHVSDSC